MSHFSRIQSTIFRRLLPVLGLVAIAPPVIAADFDLLESNVLVIAQANLLPPPPNGPFPVPDPNQFNLDPNADSYRVIAVVTSAIQEKQVKSFYPDAFAKDHLGRRVMQIGTFSDPVNAKQTALTLQHLGMEILIAP